MEFLRFDTKEKAQAALDVINNNPAFPITGINQLTDAPMLIKQKTERWSELEEYADGKFGFKKPDTEFLTQLESFNLASFIVTHKPTIEELNPAWIIDKEHE